MTTLLRNKTSWIFDLDGTLTVPVHDFAFIRQELAIPDGEDILGHLKTLPPELATQRHNRLDAIERSLATNAIAAPGALELLACLGQRGVQLGILTRNSREIALLTLEVIGIRHYFREEHLLGRDEVPPKPDPAGILQLRDCWQVELDSMVMAGDYLFDLQAGRSAGAGTIHVGRPDGLRWPEETDLMVDQLDELLVLLQ